MGFAAEETSIFRNDSFIYLFFRIMLVRSTRWRDLVRIRIIITKLYIHNFISHQVCTSSMEANWS